MSGGGGHPEVVRMMREQQKAWQRRQQARRERQADRRADARDVDDQLALFGKTARCAACGREFDLAALFFVPDGRRCVNCYGDYDAEQAVIAAQRDWTTQAWLLMVPQSVMALTGYFYIPVALLMCVPAMLVGAAGVDLAWRRGGVAPGWARWLVGAPSALAAMGWLVSGVAVWRWVLA